ncbi:hypothetical protein AURDEDRAFT_185875 [Auricularia subglabra TFB-10046 SS5]|nr:hypothetical protein AURDEDRAFT_185875 [Auricularia subglabra TFB-10046 SS5]
MADDDDFQFEPADDDRNIVTRLMRHWQDERHAPDILPFQGEIVERALQLLGEQGELVLRLQTRDDTSEEEHFKMMLVQTEMERVKFIIEKHAPYLLSTPEIQPRLSAMELSHAVTYGNLIAAQFHSAVLTNLPESMRGLTDDAPYTPSIVTPPDKSVGVFAHTRGSCEGVRLPNGKTQNWNKGLFMLIQYRTIEGALRSGDIELV